MRNDGLLQMIFWIDEIRNYSWRRAHRPNNCIICQHLIQEILVIRSLVWSTSTLLTYCPIVLWDFQNWGERPEYLFRAFLSFCNPANRRRGWAALWHDAYGRKRFRLAWSSIGSRWAVIVLVSGAAAYWYGGVEWWHGGVVGEVSFDLYAHYIQVAQ